MELISNLKARYGRSNNFQSLLVNNRWLNFEIDTGAAVTVVGWEEASRTFGKFNLFKTDTKLYNYYN